ncbi:DUF6817 domain-containing protein [Embleya hyalina]|uniref:Alpha/beta hydrolase n=1 Tax=Embleya hyalina TaxID=516124 RepID=A0A401YU40_9ACTN|nr:hypothetical protein [Embleya hyalina]GCD98096.1 alpha/beta hydrolase [Embleya hyalina]
MIVDYIRMLGADRIEHPGGTLLAHLTRVEALLDSWGARPTLRTAGLCHAFYGTDGFAPRLLPLDRRAELAGRIGVDAERIVYFYASCDRAAGHPTLVDGPFRDRFTGRTYLPAEAERRDFAELTAANELDIVRVDPEARDRYGAGLRDLLAGFRPLLSTAARDECDRVLGDRAAHTG